MKDSICFYIAIILCIVYLQLVFCTARSDDADEDVLYTRYDRAAYFAARGTDASSHSHTFDKNRIKGINRSSSSTNNNNNDDPNKCTTYLAPSSIPNSGLGMYTTIPYQKGEVFGYPEIGIVLQDQRTHFPKKSKDKLLTQYPWSAHVLTFGSHEVGYGESMVPGLGMLANSHLGLVNMRHMDLWKTASWIDGTDSLVTTDTLSMEDVGRGAHSWHGHVIFEANVNIEVGEELFVSYGDEWFKAREQLIGIVPGESQFKEADQLLRDFSIEDQKNKEAGNGDYAHRHSTYETLLSDANKKDPRLRMALPNNLNDIPTALASGTARFSVKDSIQSIEWLEENGACIDNIVSGVSTIPQAGRGAFATRSINKGQQITTTPVITLEREELYLWEMFKRTQDGGAVMELMGHQLLLNYCYGHANSSLLFFPYSPSVNFINQGNAEKANAVIRWSTVPYHKSEWLNATVDEMKAKLKTGLLFDIVATKDLHRGDEILLYYGNDWEESWEEHIEEWASTGDDFDGTHGDHQPQFNLTDRLGLATTVELNQVEKHPTVRTVDEQKAKPYPDQIMTRCHLEPPDECTASDEKATNDVECRARWKVTFDAIHLYPCTILSREHIQGMDWYTAQVNIPTKPTTARVRVEYMQRSAIKFVDRPYSRDQYAHGVFRQEIGLPDGILPPHWMDLSVDEGVVG